VFVEFAVAVDDAEGVSHFVEDGGEKIVFTSGWAVGICDVIFSQSPSRHVSLSEFTRIPRCAVEEPADSVGIVVDGDGGGFGGAVGVVAGNCSFG
jgi:hypothetical protein